MLSHFDSWSEVLEYLRSTYVTRDEPATDGVVVTIEVDATSTRAVGVCPIDVSGQAWFELTAEVSPAGNVPPLLLLQRAISIPVGGPVIDGHLIKLRQLLPGTSLAVEVLDDALSSIVKLAVEGSRSAFTTHLIEPPIRP